MPYWTWVICADSHSNLFGLVNWMTNMAELLASELPNPCIYSRYNIECHTRLSHMCLKKLAVLQSIQYISYINHSQLGFSILVTLFLTLLQSQSKLSSPPSCFPLLYLSQFYIPQFFMSPQQQPIPFS